MTAATFERVSEKEYSSTPHNESYDSVKLPARATRGSAGYDFFAPYDFTLAPGETETVATGIRAVINDGWVLMLFPRSGLGFKYRLMLDNTVGIIDSDYSDSDNEGHIFIRVTNHSDSKTLTVSRGDAFAQGVFLCYGTVEGDTADGLRNGGFGSTSEKKGNVE